MIAQSTFFRIKQSLGLIVLALPTFAGADDSMDARFVAGLNERQLFELAEFHCRDQLSRSTLPAGRRAESTRLLIRTLSLHAMNSPPEERMARWPEPRSETIFLLWNGS